MRKANDRKIKYWFKHQKMSASDYIDEMKESIKLLKEDYRFFFFDRPMEIQRTISKVIDTASKRDYYRSRIMIYYHNDAVYTVFFKKEVIDVEFFVKEDCGRKMAFAIAKGKKSCRNKTKSQKSSESMSLIA